MQNKTILITGGTTGIGLATAKLLSAEGAKVIITGRNPKTLAEAKKELPADVVVIASDSASVDDAGKLGADVKKHLGGRKLDGVFLNAGVAQFGAFETMTPKQYDEMYHVNVRGPYFQLQSLLPVLANPSSVVLTASVVAQGGFTNGSIYASTKAALVSLGHTLAVELAPRGIRVNTLSPGPISTPIFGKTGAPAEAQKGLEDALASKTLVKRMGRADEIAKFARFLLSDDSSNVVGADLLADGGIRVAAGR